MAQAHGCPQLFFYYFYDYAAGMKQNKPTEQAICEGWTGKDGEGRREGRKEGDESKEGHDHASLRGRDGDHV